MVYLMQNLRLRGRSLPIIFACIVRPINALLVLIELVFFSLGVTVEALRVKIDRKSAISLQRGHFDLKFQVDGDVPTNNFSMDS